MYVPAAWPEWIAAVGSVNRDNQMTSVCEGTGKKDNLEYSLTRKRRIGEFDGEAPVLLGSERLVTMME